MEQKLYDAASKLPETGLEFDAIQAPAKSTARPWRKIAVLAACLALVIGVGFGTYAYAEEVKEYNEAVQFFADNGLSTEGLTRKEIKAVCQDITTKSFEYEKTAEVIGNSLTPEQKNDYEKQQNDPTFENAENLWDYKMHNSMFAPVLDYIELTYCGNPYNTLTIDDPGLCSKLLGWIQKAKASGKQGESTMGHYGVLYTLKVYKDGEAEPLNFSLWDKTRYSTPAHKDSEGYAYFYEADMSELYTYLEEYYPAELFYHWTKSQISGKRLHNGNFETAIGYASGMKASEFCSNSLNVHRLPLSDARHLPIYKFDSLEEFQAFKYEYYARDEYTFGYMTANCDEAFFAKNTLLLVYANTGNRADCFDVESVECNGTALCVHLKETASDEQYGECELGCFILVAVTDSRIASCTEFDAQLQ